jgi:hypothetical protein
MSRIIRARLLAVLLSCGVAAGSASAGEPIPVPPTAPPAELAPPAPPAPSAPHAPHGPHTPVHPPRQIPQPGPGYYPRTPPAAVELPPGYPPVDSSKSDQPIRDWWTNGRPLGCWASFNTYGCNSLKSTLSFIFGSCRSFYAEPCRKGAPPSALPPWAGPESGYRGHPLPGENGRESLPGAHIRDLGTHLNRVGCPNCQ